MTKQPRIAVIEPSGRLYGSEFCLLDIIDGLHDQFDWNVVLPRGQGFDQLLLDRNVRCHFLIPAVLSAVSRAGRIPVYGRVLHRLWQLRPDLLYINQTGSLRTAAFYARLLKLPIVCQVQTLEDANWLSQRPRLQSNVRAFICNSRYIAEHTDVDATKKCVLYQGIPDSRRENAARNCQQSRRRVSAESFTIGILGRIAVSKGHYLLLEAAKELVTAMPEVRFVVIGEGLTPIDTAKYTRAVQAAGLNNYFEFRGYRTDVKSELSRLDILAIPSIAEPLGRVLFDAAEFNCPVVCSDAGGLGEVSSLFRIGTQFESRDAESLVAVIRRSAANYAEMANQFCVAAKSMFDCLSMSNYVGTVRDILNSAINGSSSSSVWLGD